MQEFVVSKPEVIAGRYQIKSSLGEGGFARVYKAIDLELGRKVAVKVLKAEFLEQAELRETFLKRFAREIEVLANLEHPHVVPIYGSGTILDEKAREVPYMVMKLLKGQDLEQMLEQSGPLPPGGVLTFGQQALDALAHVHAQGVVHKDLKPANFFLSRNSRHEPHLYIMDFGIAHTMRGDGKRMTRKDAFTGTLQYLAPEYMMEQLAEPSVDVYQMGLILLETLTNQPVIAPETSLNELIARFLRREPVPIPEHLQGTGVGEVLRRATLYDHRERYRDASEFLRAWEALGVEDFPASLRTGLSNDALPIPTLDDESSVTIPRPVLEPHTTPATTPSTSNDSSQVGVLVGVALALVVLIAACAVVVVTLVKGDEGSVSRTQSEPEFVEASETIVDMKPDVVQEKAPSRKDAPPKIIMRTITVEPEGAHIYIDGEYRGTGPVTLPASQGFELGVKLAGFEELTRRVEPGEEAVSVTMVKVPARAKEGKKKPRKERERVEETEAKVDKPRTTLPPEH